MSGLALAGALALTGCRNVDLADTGTLDSAYEVPTGLDSGGPIDTDTGGVQAEYADLVLTSLGLGTSSSDGNDSFDSADSADTLIAQACATNEGEVSSPATDLQVSFGNNVSSNSIPYLAPGETACVENTYAPQAAGDYTLMAHVDASNAIDENNEDNNTMSTDVEILAVEELMPNLMIQEMSTSEVAMPGGMEPVTVTVVIRNDGDTAASASTLHVTQEKLNPEDSADTAQWASNWDVVIPALEAGKTYRYSFDVADGAPVEIGQFEWTATIDSKEEVEESNEDDNTAEAQVEVI